MKAKAGPQSRKETTPWKNMIWLAISQACLAGLPRDDTAHSGLGPPTPFSNQTNFAEKGPQDNLMEVVTIPRALCVEEGWQWKLISSLFCLLVIIYGHVIGVFLIFLCMQIGTTTFCSRFLFTWGWLLISTIDLLPASHEPGCTVTV